MSSVHLHVEVDECDLKDAGYHHDDDCEKRSLDVDRFSAALDYFHTELHGQIPIRVCTSEPCRSLYLAAQGMVA